MNNLGFASFRTSLDGGGAAVAKGSGGTTTTIGATTDPIVSSLFGYTDINELGQVAFAAGRDSGGTAIFVGDGTSSLVEIASTDDGFSGFSGELALNDLGNVVFEASYGGFAIFDGPDPLLNLAVGIGTELEPGVFAAGTTLSNMSLNNSGSFVFHAMISGGGEAIYRADLVIPEPGVIQLFLAAAATVFALLRIVGGRVRVY